MTRANGASTTWSYNAAGHLSQLKHDLPGTADDQTLTYTYNPAGQILTRVMSNTAYAYAPGAGTVSYTNNGRNQVTSVGGSAVSYDARQNITSAPAMGTYAYDNLNQMITATVGGTGTSFTYDPAGRMSQMGTTRLLHDGARPIAEYNAAGAILRRYVPGLAMDETVTAYEGSGLTDRRWLLADERLSVTAYINGAGGILARNTYDEYGQPGVGNAGLFQYTGQIWLPQAQAYNYKARVYAPQLGRLMQTDPIGYGDGANFYAYVGGDPINLMDPWGLCGEDGNPCVVDEIRVKVLRQTVKIDGGSGCWWGCRVWRYVTGGARKASPAPAPAAAPPQPRPAQSLSYLPDDKAGQYFPNDGQPFPRQLFRWCAREPGGRSRSKLPTTRPATRRQ